MSMPKALGTRLALLQISAFMTHGFYLPFFPLWLQSRALTATLISVIMTLPIIIRVVVGTPLLMLADKGVGARVLLGWFFLGQAIFYPFLLLAHDGFLVTALSALIAFAQTSVIPASDLVTTNETQRYGHLNYGRIRSIGSMAFLFANIVGGYLIGLKGDDVVIWALTFIPMMGIVICAFVLPREAIKLGRAPGQVTALAPKLPFLLYIIMIAASLTQASHGALNTFASIYWQSSGVPDAVIGAFWGIGVVAEIGVFFILGRFVGKSSQGIVLILIGSVAAILRFAAMSLEPGIPVTFILQIMHGLSFGASHLGMMTSLTALAPHGTRGQAQGLYGSINALFTVASMLVSGLIYYRAGAMVFAAMVPLGVAGLVLTLIVMRMSKAYPQSAPAGG